MRFAFFIVPGRIDRATGGYVYDRRIVSGLRTTGWTIEVRELDDTFPSPSEETLRRATAVFAGLPDDSIVIVDGLAFGAMPEVVEAHAGRLRLVALVHLPQSCDVTLDGELRQARERRERVALERASLIVVTGSTSVEVIAGYGIPASRIALVEPGTDIGPAARGSSNDWVQMLCVGTVTGIKGHDVLIRALDGIRDLPWRLRCVGSLVRDPGFAARLEESIERSRLRDRVQLAGELTHECLELMFEESDLFVLGTRFETYGMAVAEALGHGLPVVSTRTGSIPRLVGSDAGFVVPPGDEAALRDALRRAVGDAELRRRLRQGAVRARERLTSWSSAVDAFAAALRQVSAAA